MSFKPGAAATAIGSFPHKEAGEACKLIFDSIPEIPVWPQLPARSFYEDMSNQYSKALPCYYIDEEKNKAGFNTDNDFAGELERFYTNFIEENLEYFGLDEKYSQGFSTFAEHASKADRGSLLAVKGHVTGPLTMGLATDIVDGKYAIYKPDIFDAIIKNSYLNARWQVKKLKGICDNVIIFIDEPSLTVLGSGFYSIDTDLVMNSFREVIAEIRKEGGIPGMHCCGNADWNQIGGLGLDMINFDAADEIVADKLINSGKIKEYVESGGIIAWGVVPTIGEKIEGANYEKVEGNFHSLIKNLAAKGIKEDILLEQSIITPSCGTGTLSIELAQKALGLAGELSRNIKGAGK